MSAKPSIGVAVIGLGRAGMIHARNYAAGVTGARLVAVADPDPGALARARADLGVDHGYGEALAAIGDPHVQAVVIATPTAHHREIAVAAAQARKHVFCEKPMAMRPQDCEEMIRAAASSAVKLQIGFMRRFDQGFVDAKARVDAGEIGAVVQVKSITHGPSTPKPWMYDLRQSNGPLAEVNSHDVDTLRWFTGSEFRRVFALGGNYRCAEARTSHPDFYDNVLLMASFDNSMQGMIGGAQGVKYAYDARLEILGTEGLICVGGLHAGNVATYSTRGAHRPLVASWTELFADAYRAEDEAFVRCVLDDQPPAASGVDGLRAVEVVNAGNESIRTGQPVAPERRGIAS
jgi:predicted dehydrogenase